MQQARPTLLSSFFMKIIFFRVAFYGKSWQHELCVFLVSTSAQIRLGAPLQTKSSQSQCDKLAKNIGTVQDSTTKKDISKCPKNTCFKCSKGSSIFVDLVMFILFTTDLATCLELSLANSLGAVHEGPTADTSCPCSHHQSQLQSILMP